MKRMMFLCATLLMAVATTFAANVKKEYAVGNFKNIELIGSPSVIITQGKNIKVNAEGPQELIDDMIVKVVNNKLVITQNKKVKSSWFKASKSSGYVKLYIEMPLLGSLEVIGAGDIIVKDKMKWDSSVLMEIKGSGDIRVNTVTPDNLILSVKGSGDIDINTVKVSFLDVSVKGSGDIEVKDVQADTMKAGVYGSGDLDLKKGKVRLANYTVSGSGDISASNVKTDKVEALVAGSGDIRCYAQQAISGKVTGSGEVYYKGHPKQINVSEKGFHGAK